MNLTIKLGLVWFVLALGTGALAQERIDNLAQGGAKRPVQQMSASKYVICDVSVSFIDRATSERFTICSKPTFVTELNNDPETLTMKKTESECAEGSSGSGTNANIPEHFALGRNYPNPFNPTTTISYSLPTDAQVQLLIYNLHGQVVRTLVDGFEAAGSKTVVWDGTNNSGQAVPSAVYFYRFEVPGEFSQTKSMVLLK